MIQTLDLANTDNINFNSNEVEVLKLNNDVIWEKVQNIPIIFAVKRYQPGSGDESSNKSISFNVTAGAGGDAYAEYGGITKTIPAGTTVDINYGLYDGVDDGTPETGNITFSGYVDSIAGATWTGSTKGATAVGYHCVTDVIDWGSLTKIGSYLFGQGCFVNKDVVLSNKIKSIAPQAFYQCSLNSITFTNTPVEIGENAFEDSYLKSFTFPDWLTTIPYGLLMGCNYLTTVVMPNTVTDWGEVPGLMNAMDSGYLCYQCSALTSVTLSNKLKKIAQYSFMSATSLTNIIVPEGIEEIETYAFNNDTSLISITLPSSMKTIGTYVFGGCTALTTVKVRATTPPTLGTVFPSNVTRIEVPSASLSAYQSADVWSNHASVMVGV